ncbi:hypothetical protein K8089_07965 [Aequorivita sp. F47161]|uniref:DUF4468 domain-containing protein n=1 Tax=Aequorivita vitellina TaxID=2874475 RepID=A0A9X1U9U9_9FLAO|nr:hypothetical protein [Aequorivita vitellina]MCG2418956.1 hypothetical protein [Aequorivita vitellina]MCZ4319608.1 hypothetical protein [Aequorivita viscosa]
MKNILFLFALLLGTTGFAQNDEAYVNSLVAQKFAELELQQNQEYFLRKDYCDGQVMIFNMPDGSLCTSSSTYYAVYVFWKESDSVLKIQKFDNCGSYMPISISRSKVFVKAIADRDALMNGEVKPYKGEQVDENAFGNMSVESCHKAYKFVLGGIKFEKKFREFDLTNESKYKNVNAEHNNSLQLIKLDELISELVNHFEDNGKFIRER